MHQTLINHEDGKTKNKKNALARVLESIHVHFKQTTGQNKKNAIKNHSNGTKRTCRADEIQHSRCARVGRSVIGAIGREGIFRPYVRPRFT
jgi:hypothetical protein